MKDYKIKKGFLIQKIKNKITVFSGEDSFLYTLNDSAGYIFQGIKLKWSEEKIISGLKDQYHIEVETAKQDFIDCLKVLKGYKIIEEHKSSKS